MGGGQGGLLSRQLAKKCKNRPILVLSSDIRRRALMNRLVENWKQTSKLLRRQCLHIMKSCHFCLNCVAISSQSTIYMPMSAFCIFIWKVSQYQQIWREDCKSRKGVRLKESKENVYEQKPKVKKIKTSWRVEEWQRMVPIDILFLPTVLWTARKKYVLVRKLAPILKQHLSEYVASQTVDRSWVRSQGHVDQWHIQ